MIKSSIDTGTGWMSLLLTRQQSDWVILIYNNVFVNYVSALPPESAIYNQLNTVASLKDYGEMLQLLGKEENENNDKNFEIILRDEYGTVKVDNNGNPITMNYRPPTYLVGRVFLTKPDTSGNCHQARIIKVVKEYEDKKMSIKIPSTGGTEFR